MFRFISKKSAGATEPDESSLSEDQLRELIYGIEDKEFRARLPSLSQKKALEIAPRHRSASLLLQEKGAALIARLGGLREKEAGGPSSQAGTFILSHYESLPFLDSSLDFILLRTSFFKASLGRVLREAGRVLDIKGSVLLSDLHPFNVAILKEQQRSPVPDFSNEEGMRPGFERYLKWFREAGFRFEWVKEIFFEGTMKKKGPLLILFSLKKE